MNLKPKTKEESDPSEMNFKEWALAKYREIEKVINPCDENGNLNPQRLNEVLTQFSNHFCWAITIQEVETNMLNKMNHEYDRWYKTAYNSSLRILSEESSGTRAPSQMNIEARIVQLFGDEVEQKQEALSNQKSRVDLLKAFVKVLERQASTLQTLSSNMRSELFFASGITIGSNRMSESSKNESSKAMLRNAMKAQS